MKYFTLENRLKIKVQAVLEHLYLKNLLRHPTMVGYRFIHFIYCSISRFLIETTWTVWTDRWKKYIVVGVPTKKQLNLKIVENGASPKENTKNKMSNPL